MLYFCCDEPRRDAVRHHPTLNGVDYLEVGDPSLPTDPEKQLTLYLFLLKVPGTLTLKPSTVRLVGGERIPAVPTPSAAPVLPPASGGGLGGFFGRIFGQRPVPLLDPVPVSANAATLEQVYVTGVKPSPTPTAPTRVAVTVNTWGDYSNYTLRLSNPGTDQPLDGLDPLLAEVSFTFKVDCPTDFDCAPVPYCPPETLVEPELDYLAKDYNSFRQLLLDRMSVLLPQWQERHAADLGVALVELLAYAGDSLSYRQDAIATEAYLGTARRRISVRRHARLVDYAMHDGRNARAWVQIQVSADGMSVPGGTQLFTRVSGLPIRIAPGSSDYTNAVRQQPVIFETIADPPHMPDPPLIPPLTAYVDHNELHFYAWGAHQCCLPRGATRATLVGDHPNLHVGDVLIFEEVLGPLTGQPEDADPAHRCVVRLTEVNRPLTDPLFLTPPANTPVAITEIAWAPADALPFALTISSETDEAHGHQPLAFVSVARGNVVLADHGMTVAGEAIGTVPAPVASLAVVAAGGDRCAPGEPQPIYPRFNPRVAQAPLTQRAMLALPEPGTTQLVLEPYDPTAPAIQATPGAQDLPGDILPDITLQDNVGGGNIWLPRRDLLASDQFAKEFVAEVDEDGRATLRFGDDTYGERPAAGVTFAATYRAGNGTAGNIAAEALCHIVSNDSRVVSVRNPLSARGGIEPESIEQVRQDAPAAFRTQERAVTAADYAAVAERHAEVLRAVATFRWTGSWRTVFLTVERSAGQPVDDAFRQDLEAFMERYRMAGHDLDVDGPIYVPLEIDMTVCVKPDYFRGDVKAALLEVFSNHLLSGGRRGVFYPDNFSFGQTVYLSPIYAAAQAVEGVASAQVTTFQRRDTHTDQGLRDGKLAFGRLEIAQLANDPNFPERGVFRLVLMGGK